MANTLLTPTKITREALRILHNNLVFTRNVNRQYDDQFAQSGAKIGTTLKVRKPNQFTIRTGAVMNAQDVTEESLDLVVSTQKGVDINFSSQELTLNIDDFSNRYLVPAMARLASEIDYEGLTLYQNIFNQVGTPGTTPATSLIVLQTGQKMDDFAAPDDMQRFLTVNPAAQASIVDALKGLFQQSSAIAEQYRRGKMGTALGFDWGMSQNINRHTTGGFAGTVLVNDTVASGDTTISMDAFTDAAPTVKKGDIFTLAGVNAVNPETKKSTGVLQQFVVTADKTGASNAIADIAISPAITTSGPKQTVTALPSDNAAVTFVGTAATAYPINMAYHRDAFALVTADLEMPKGVDFAAREVYEGISMRIVRQFDITNDKFPCRIDVLYGWTTLRPEFACRLIG